MVKLQKRFAYEHKGEKHYKHIVTVSKNIVRDLGWSEGVELSTSIQDGKLVFEVTRTKEMPETQ